MHTSLAFANIGQGLENAWSTTIGFLPLLGGFLLILIVGWIIAKLIGWAIGKGLARVGFDRALERGGMGDYMRRSRYSASDLVGRVVYYVLLLVVLQQAFSVFGPQNPISQLLNAIIAWIPQAIVAVVIIVVAVAIARMLRDVMAGALGGLSYGRFLANLVAVFIIALGVIAALNQIGVATAVTQPVLIAVLATIGGVLVVGAGGGLIRPMQERWARWLNVAEEETAKIQAGEAAEPSYRRGREDAMAGGTERRESSERSEHSTGVFGATRTSEHEGPERGRE